MTILDIHPDQHVAHREGLNEALRANLSGPPRDKWRDHPNFLTSYAYRLYSGHRGLLRLAKAYTEGLTSVAAWQGRDHAQHPALAEALKHGSRLGLKTHTHHKFEDNSVFPAMTRDHPRIAEPLALLENDHDVVAEGLDQLDQNIKYLRQGGFSKRELDQALAQGTWLERILRRHLYDEEDIIMPIYLQYY